MIDLIKEKGQIVAERFGQAWTSCMVAMVGGDLTVLSTKHAIIASKTGIITGLAMLAASFVPWEQVRENKWFSIFLVGVFTILGDLWNHPTHYGLAATEAIVTGFGAMILAVIYEKATAKRSK